MPKKKELSITERMKQVAKTIAELQARCTAIEAERDAVNAADQSNGATDNDSAFSYSAARMPIDIKLCELIKKQLYASAKLENPGFFPTQKNDTYWQRYLTADDVFKEKLNAFIATVAQENSLAIPEGQAYFEINSVRTAGS